MREKAFVFYPNRSLSTHRDTHRHASRPFVFACQWTGVTRMADTARGRQAATTPATPTRLCHRNTLPPHLDRWCGVSSESGHDEVGFACI